ncbi:MAG: phage terminase large subunit [Halanaerobiales bacterium]|nr:phage terminase large subunit [Halanaerobiales bacterium]
MPFSNDYIKQLQSDFRNFLYVIWKHLGLPEPTKVQYEIAWYLQFGPKRKIIEAFRGVGKSWITSAYVLWRLFRDPNYKALVVSASKTRSTDFNTFTKRLIREVPILQHLQPSSGQRDSMVAFDVAPAKAAHAPSVKSVGIFGQLTSSRAVEIIADDVEVPGNSTTQDMRDKLIKTCMEFEAIILPEIGQITYLGTPQTEENL